MNAIGASTIPDAAIDHLQVMVRDLDGTITYWSRALHDLFGWTPEEAQGQIFHQFLQTEFPRLLPDIEAELIREGSIELELSHRRKTGERIVLASRWVLRRDANGTPTSILESNIDIGRIKAAAERLRQREELLRLCIDAAPIGIAMFDRDMRYLAASRSHVDDLRIGDEQVIGRTMYDLIPNMPDHWRAAHRRCLAGAHEHCDADAVGRADGAIDWYRWKIRPWRTADGAPAGIVLLTENITERVTAERARRDSEAQARRSADLLDKIVASMSDAVLVVDGNGKTIFANPACTALFGEASHIGLGELQRNYLRFRPDGITPYPAEDAPLGRAMRGENFDNQEIVCRRIDEARGSHLVASGRSIRDEAGNHDNAVIVYRDITELTEKTAALRRNAEIFENIMSSMSEAVLLLDENADVVFANEAARSALGDHAATGLKDWVETYELYVADAVTRLPLAQWPAVRAVGGEQIDDCDLVVRARGATGRAARLMLSARPIRDRLGAPKGAVVVFRDVTELFETERELRQSQKMDAIGQLTGGIAHDFNNLLTVMTGTVEILAEGVADRPKLAAIVEMIDQAATRGADLTQRLLAFARRQPLQPRPTDLAGLVTESAELLRHTIGEHVEIQLVVPGDACQAMVDPSQLSTAILNLAVNARDAMPDGGRLIFEIANVVLDDGHARLNPDAVPGCYAMMAVSDTGTGIPASVLDQVCEPFFTTKDAGKGTGLGLSMVYGFVKQSGGHLRIDSEEGRGTTVRLYLPRADESTAPLPDMEAAAVRPGGGESILVVEDDTLVRETVVGQLERLGYRTIAASSGAEALELVDQGIEFDLLFTDVLMPGGMNGRQLADQVAKRRPAARVLYTSGYAKHALAVDGRISPGVHLLSKPYQMTDLAREIRAVLDDAASCA